MTYRATIGPLYAYVSRRVGGDVSLAEDLVQDTWMRAIRTWPAKGVPAEPLAWLIRVARNTLIATRRARPQLVEPALLDLVAKEPFVAADDPTAASAINWGSRSYVDGTRSCWKTSTCREERARHRARPVVVGAQSKDGCGAPARN